MKNVINKLFDIWNNKSSRKVLLFVISDVIQDLNVHLWILTPKNCNRLLWIVYIFEVIWKLWEINTIACHFSGNGDDKIIPDLSNRNYESYIGCQTGQDLTKLHLCLGCNYTNKRKSVVKRHLMAVHSPFEVVDCSICGFRLKNRERFKQHLTEKRHKQAVQRLKQQQ